MTKSKLIIQLCVTIVFSFVSLNAFAQETKVIRKVYYDSASKNYFRYIKDSSQIGLFTIEKLLADKKTKNGVSVDYYYGENRDTSMHISFYKSGKIAPLRLSAEKKKNFSIESIMEYTPKIGVIEPWRDAFYAVFANSISDSLRLYYLRAKDTVFIDDYYLGYRQNRKILKQEIFDKLYASTQTPGAKIFYSSCTSCHNPYKDATGPKLVGITKKRTDEWLRKWIRNSAKMIADNDPIAVSEYNEWHKTAMTSFPLSNDEMDKLIAFLKTL